MTALTHQPFEAHARRRRPMRHYSPLRAGFTLIELMGVIAIVAIPAAMLVPPLAAAKEKARRTQCASRCKQLSSATQMFINERDNLPDANWSRGHC